MHRVPKNNQWRKDLAEWKGCSWSVHMTVNGRMVVDHVSVHATKTIGPDITVNGHAASSIAPFDNLRDIVTALLVESAMNATDELFSADQGTLFEGPTE